MTLSRLFIFLSPTRALIVRSLHTFAVPQFLFSFLGSNRCHKKYTAEKKSTTHVCMLSELRKTLKRSGTAASYTMTSPQSTMLGFHLLVSSSPSILLGTVTSMGR